MNFFENLPFLAYNKIIELGFSNLIFQKSSRDQQGDKVHKALLWTACIIYFIPLLICTWLLKNQAGKTKFDELDF